MNQARIETIRKYYDDNRTNYSEESLKNQLLKTGYTQEEIDFAISKPSTSQDTSIPANNSYQTPNNMGPKAYNSNRVGYKKLVIKMAVIGISIALAGTAWWTIDTFIFYKGIKIGTHEINEELNSTKYEDDVITIVDKIESDENKIKLHITVKNNLEDQEYTMSGSILRSFKIKDQDDNKLDPFEIDYIQETGGELDTYHITIDPEDKASGWISFINPRDKKIKFITIENKLFETSSKIYPWTTLDINIAFV